MSVQERPFEQEVEISRYYRDDFLSDLVDGAALVKRAEPGDHCQRIELYQGMTLPSELRQFLRMRDNFEFSKSKLGAWHIVDEEFGLPDPAKGNLAEQLIVADQQRPHATGLFEYFAWCVRIGRADNGDVYFATFDKRQPGNSEVVFWDQQEQQMPYYLADSISSLAYTNHLLATVQGEREGDKTTIKKKAKRLKKRTRLPEHYAELEQAGKFEGQYEGNDVARYLYYRSLWIARLLQNRDPGDLGDTEAFFSMVEVPWSDLDDAVAKGTLAQSPPAAFYWLWRCFLFQRSESLAMLMAHTRKGVNPLIDDMTTLVEELQAGRKTLGSIADVQQLRDQFVALDLDAASDG